MSLYPYIPPLFAIYLILISSLVSGYAKSLIADNVQRNIALDWETRIGAINAMVSSLVTLYSIFETSQSYKWLTITSIALIFIFVPTLFWIFSHKAGQLASLRTHRGRILHSKMCATIIIIVNLLLIGAIFVNQQATTPISEEKSSAQSALVDPKVDCPI